MDIPKLVKKQKFPKNSYIVVASGIMNALNIRKSDDIDLITSDELYKQLKNQGWEEIDKGGYKVILKDTFEAGLSWDSENEKPNLNELFKDAIYVDDVPFIDLGRVREWKAKMGRPKDVKDIALIDEYLGEGGKDINTMSAEVAKFFNLPKINVNIHIIKSRNEFDKLYGKKTEDWLVGFADKEKINILDKNKFETDSIHSKSHFASTLKHEISHIYFRKLNPNGHPNWLDEGTAYVVADQKENEPKEVTVEILKTYSRGSDRKIYSVGYFMVKQIIIEYGKDKLFELIKINDEDKILSELKAMFKWLE